MTNINAEDYGNYIQNIVENDKSGLFNQLVSEQFHPEAIVLLGSYMYVLERIGKVENLFLPELKDVLNMLGQEISQQEENDTSTESLPMGETGLES